jgi:hypothetical protein
MSSKIFCAESGNSIVLVDVIQIKIANVTRLTMTASIDVVTSARKNNAYIKWVVSLSVFMIEPFATSV